MAASYREPWQGQSSSLPAGFTVQPILVHFALSPITCPLVGWATIIGCPSGPVAETAPPTGTWLSATIVLPAPEEPPDEPIDDAAAEVGAAEDAAVDAADDAAVAVVPPGL